MKNNYVRITAIQIVLVLIGALSETKDSSQHLPWFWALGGFISASQFGLLYLLWWRIFTKKKIAPSVSTVVIKYALLGMIFWYLPPLETSQIRALFLGVITNPVAIVLFAVLKKSK